MILAVATLLASMTASPDIQIAAPEGSGPVSLALIDTGPGLFLNFLDFAGPDGEPDGVDSSLFEHSGTRLVRLLAGPPVPAHLTARRVYPEMASARMGRMLRLAVLERTEAGYWHIQWDQEVRGGRFCLPREVIAHFRIVAHGRIPGHDGAICLDV